MHMLLPPNRSIRIVRLEAVEGDAAEAKSRWVSVFSGRDWAVGAEVFKQSPHSSVLRSMVLSRDLVLKTRHASGLKALAQSLTQSGREERQWSGSEWLRSIGLSAPHCVAIVAGSRDGAPVRTLITEYVPGHTLLWQIARGLVKEDPESPPSRAIAYETGRGIAQIIKSGRFNRDHKPSNLVVVAAGPPVARISIVDAVAIQPYKPAERAHALARMIASLQIEPAGIGHPIPHTFLKRIVDAIAHEMVGPADADSWSRDMLSSAEQHVQKHGDPTPQHDPLVGSH
ncbi:MAG: hypothetical protein KF902_03875 [Phycisphaeraceae bacterium]|nr:hypothetical protein [Phycisphaeraceae bacterium]